MSTLTSPSLLSPPERSLLRANLAVLAVLVTASGVPLFNALSFGFGSADSPHIGGSTGGLPAFWVQAAIVTVTVVAVSCFSVGSRELGLDGNILNKLDSTAFKKIIPTALYSMGIASVLAILTIWAFDIVPTVPPMMDNQWYTLPSTLTSGIVEEIPFAAVAVLMCRAKWPLWTVYVSIVTVRAAYYFTQGWAMLLPVAMWASVYLWLFLRYRNVVALVVAHAFIDVFVWVRDNYFGSII